MPDPGFKVPNGATATHLVAKRYDLGSLGVPGPASTPLGRRGQATSSIDPKLDLDLDKSDLGFDQISSHKRGDVWLFRAHHPPCVAILGILCSRGYTVHFLIGPGMLVVYSIGPTQL